MRWEFVAAGLKNGLTLDFEDQGPGIADLDLALTDGWTSGGGLGMGLSGSRRLVNDFKIRTAPGAGTCVTITRWK
jgi:serine/threonine-protein kinase RsbT